MLKGKEGCNCELLQARTKLHLHSGRDCLTTIFDCNFCGQWAKKLLQFHGTHQASQGQLIKSRECAIYQLYFKQIFLIYKSIPKIVKKHTKTVEFLNPNTLIIYIYNLFIIFTPFCRENNPRCARSDLVTAWEWSLLWRPVVPINPAYCGTKNIQICNH